MRGVTYRVSAYICVIKNMCIPNSSTGEGDLILPSSVIIGSLLLSPLTGNPLGQLGEKACCDGGGDTGGVSTSCDRIG